MELVFGGVTALAIVALLIVIAIQSRQITAATQALNAINQNPKILDTVESAAVKVVPAWLIPIVMSGGEGVKQLLQSPDGKAFVDALLTFVRQTTDGLPNTPAAELHPNG